MRKPKAHAPARSIPCRRLCAPNALQPDSRHSADVKGHAHGTPEREHNVPQFAWEVWHHRTKSFA